jgi:oxygen-dependent protoporphyrinogen oxidase
MIPMANPDTNRRRIAVLGGGISGLTAAYTLARARQSGAPIEEFLIEANDHLGGVIRTERVAGFIIEAGPDSFLTEKPEAAALCRDLGLGADLLGSNDDGRRTYILHRGKLVPLPDGLMLLVPTRVWPMISTPLLPFRSKLSLASEWMLPPSGEKQKTDESVADFVRRHFGSAMLENIADPLLAGVYGGDSAALSARSVLPRFWKMETTYGSLTRGTLKARRERRAEGHEASPARAPAPSLFSSLKNGLGSLIEALTANLDVDRLHQRQRIKGIENGEVNTEVRYRIRCDGGSSYEADAIILALPAFECSRLLAGVDAQLAATLAEITYSSAMTVALGYDAQAVSRLPAGFGFLVPRKENHRLLACTFVQNKFSHRAPAGQALLRCFLGGARDSEVLSLSDEAAVALVRNELESIMGFSAAPILSRVHRWPSSMAQYRVGHESILGEIQTRLNEHPMLALAGNAYSGIGISDCIRTGRAAAERVLRNLGG